MAAPRIHHGKHSHNTLSLPSHALLIKMHFQAGVAGAVVVLDGIFNRDTRDPLTVSERTLLNDSFTYTGVGLTLTAVAARSLFRSGAAFRIMSANPCVYICNQSSSFVLTNLLRDGSGSQLSWKYRYHDGHYVDASREDRPEALVLACKQRILQCITAFDLSGSVGL